jgi:flavin-dependent dehydrogenase
MKEIKILGAGISGLTAAINLAKNNYNVVVYEKNSGVGERFNGDFQGLENWTSKNDILTFIKTVNIKTDFLYKPVKKATFYSPSLNKAEFITKRPFLYLVKRGGKGALEETLKKQATNLGVKIKFNTTLSENEAHIISSGPKKPSVIATGINFKTNIKDKAICILNDEIAPKGYAYLLVVEKRATLVTVLFKDFKNSANYLEKTINEFKKIFDFQIKNKKIFGGYGSFFIPASAIKENRIYTGEAAGFQDALAGFGMKYALLSGYLAAQSIIIKKDYDELWKKEFLGQMKTSFVNRFLFERFGNKGYEKIITKCRNVKNISELLYKKYNTSSYKNLIYPIAKLIRRI